MTEDAASLRILIANERRDRLERIAEVVTDLGHEVIARELEVSEVAAATEREHPVPFARRAVIERAKGIMMARQAIDERKAFELLRAQSQRSGHKLFDVAEAVVESHMLLVPPTA